LLQVFIWENKGKQSQFLFSNTDVLPYLLNLYAFKGTLIIYYLEGRTLKIRSIYRGQNSGRIQYPLSFHLSINALAPTLSFKSFHSRSSMYKPSTTSSHHL